MESRGHAAALWNTNGTWYEYIGSNVVVFQNAHLPLWYVDEETTSNDENIHTWDMVEWEAIYFSNTMLISNFMEMNILYGSVTT